MIEADRLKFRGGWVVAFVPLLVFLFFCVLFFVVLQAFSLIALAMGGFVALLVGAMLARDYERYWDSVMRGIGSQTAVSIVVMLFVIGMFSALIKATNVSGGFVWLADELSMSGAVFTLFTFVTVCVVSMATGSSVGTTFTAFPIFFPAGIILGASPGMLAGALVSGAMFGDNLAPISDTTIMSASTQRFRTKAGVADIAGVVSTRAKYALPAAVLSAIGFLLFGGGGDLRSGAVAIMEKSENQAALIMLLPVAVMLVVAFITRSIFKAVTVGIVLGALTGLAFGLLDPKDVIGIHDSVPTGFLVTGIDGMLGTVALVVAVFGMMGVLTEAGILERTVDALSRGNLASTPRGAECAIGLGASATTLLFGGIYSASILTFGPVADEIGSRVNLHPYRRANIMDCFAMGLASVVPFLSASLVIAAQLTSGYDGVSEVSVQAIFLGALYPLVLTIILAVCVITGWGRRFEGPDGVQTKTRSPELGATDSLKTPLAASQQVDQRWTPGRRKPLG